MKNIQNVCKFMYGFTIDKFRSYLRTYYKKSCFQKETLPDLSLSSVKSKPTAHKQNIFSRFDKYSKFKKEEKTKESHLRRTLCISSTSGSFQSFSTLQIDLDQIGKMPRRPES